MPTIFDSIVRKENDYTNLLCNLLGREPAFAAAALGYLLDRRVSGSEISSFVYRTQPRIIDSGDLMIPDLVIEGPNLYCVVEVKTSYDTDTQPSQAEGYLRCFPRKAERHFIFLVTLDWKDAGKLAFVESACCSENILTRKRTWQDLAKELRTTEIVDQVVKESIDFLWESFEVFKMEPSELDAIKVWRDTYAAFRKLERTLDQAEKIFRAHGFETERETSDLDAYGFYIKRNKKYRLWVGLWTDAASILSYGYHLSGSEWEKPASEPSASEITKDGKHRLWPLPASSFAHPQQVFDIVSKMVDKSWTKSQGQS